MISSENLFSNLLTIFILLTLAIIVYAKVTKKSLSDMVRDIKEMFSDRTEEVQDYIPNAFESIR